MAHPENAPIVTTFSVQTPEERQMLDDLAKERGVIDAGTSRTGFRPMPQPGKDVIDAGISRVNGGIPYKESETTEVQD